MRLEQMRDAVRVRIGVPTGDSFYTDTALNDLVNEALQVISSEVDWPWLTASTTFSTVAGTGTYTPPTDWNRTISLCIDGYDAIEWRSLIEIREYITTIRDIPTVYTVHGEQLLLRPTPGAVYVVTHDYIKDDPALVNNTDTPLMPSQFHYSIVAFACHLAYLRSGDIQRATAALADYHAWQARMLGQRRRSSGPIRVRVRPGSVL